MINGEWSQSPVGCVTVRSCIRTQCVWSGRWVDMCSMGDLLGLTSGTQGSLQRCVWVEILIRLAAAESFIHVARQALVLVLLLQVCTPGDRKPSSATQRPNKAQRQSHPQGVRCNIRIPRTGWQNRKEELFICENLTTSSHADVLFMCARRG